MNLMGTNMDIPKIAKGCRMSNNKEFIKYLMSVKHIGQNTDSLLYRRAYKIKVDIQQKNMDHWTLIVGGEGKGKSTLGIDLASLVSSETFSYAHFFWDIKEFLWHTYPDNGFTVKGDTKFCDEGKDVFDARSFATTEMKDAVKTATKLRFLNLHFIICISQIAELEKFFRGFRIKTLIHVTGKGKYTMYLGKNTISQIIDQCVKQKVDIQHTKIKDPIYIRGWFNKDIPDINGIENYDKYEIVKLQNYKRNHLKLLEKYGAIPKEEEEIDSDDHYMSVKEVSDYIGIKSLTIRKMINDGKLEARKFGLKWLVKKSILEEFMKKCSLE